MYSLSNSLIKSNLIENPTNNNSQKIVLFGLKYEEGNENKLRII